MTRTREACADAAWTVIASVLRSTPTLQRDIVPMVRSNTSMARRFRFVAGLALLVAATAGLTACGDSKPDAASLLKDAFGSSHSVKSGKLDVKLVLDANGLKSL